MEYWPIIEFVYKDKNYKLRSLGRFHHKPAKVGETIDIYYLKQYPDKVVVKDPHYNNKYLLSILFFIALYVLVVAGIL